MARLSLVGNGATEPRIGERLVGEPARWLANRRGIARELVLILLAKRLVTVSNQCLGDSRGYRQPESEWGRGGLL